MDREAWGYIPWDYKESDATEATEGLSNEYSGFISFRIDGFDLLAVQGTLKSLL